GLDATNSRGTFYGRVSYDLNADTNVYATVSYGAVRTEDVPFEGQYKTGNLVIQCDNAYLPASVKMGIATNKITSSAYGNCNQAVVAVSAQGGTILCRSALAAPTNACVPLNIIGTGMASQQAINAISGTAWIATQQRQEAASFSVNGAPFSSWAGSVSIAAG